MDERDFHDRFYDGEAERIFSSPLYRELLDLHVKFLLEVTPGLAAGRILSIGCGDGRRELAMARYAGQILAFDVSGVAIRKARQRALAMGVDNVEFQVDDADGLGGRFRSEFDAVWCAGVLHHLHDVQIATLLRSSRSALKAGGRFVSMDPNALRAVNVFKPFVRRLYDRHHSAGERELRPAAVVAMLESAGFHGIEVRFTDSFISPLAWAFPRLTGPIAPLLARLDRLLVRIPVVNEVSSGFAAIARAGG
jgi:SAM-dependent methyltransferase